MSKSRFLVPMLVAAGVLAMSAAGADDALVERAGGVIADHRASEPRVAGPFDSLFPPRTEVVEVDETEDGGVRLLFNGSMANRVWLAEDADRLRAVLREGLGLDEEPEIAIQMGHARDVWWEAPLDELVTSPETVRARHSAVDAFAGIRPLAAPVVQRVDYAGPPVEAGMAGRHVVVAPSHGMTWHKENRWQWQRARLHTTVEDQFTSAYANTFLMPMLENAGAVVFSVRERDYQRAEVIVDNDGWPAHSRFSTTGDWARTAGGWRGGEAFVMDEMMEPFTRGTNLRAAVPHDNEDAEHASATYTPYIPLAGRYAVYASWSASRANSSSVPVRIRHAGGETVVHVNQQVAGGTWVYLGHFEFAHGADAKSGSVVVSTEGAAPHPVRETEDGEDEPRRRRAFVSVDAIKFGGGMGNAAPGGVLSHLPRQTEGSRYWLQYAGAPRDMVFLRDLDDGHFGVDYNRDYVSRSQWPNYLMGRPFGPTGGYGDAPGLGVPIDLYLSWHSDAGVDHEGVFGGHVIYTTVGADGRNEYPDGRSRLLGRDLSALIDYEMVRTARELYTSTWQHSSRGSLAERPLAESRTPNTPAALIEMFSHQNLNDMKYGLDPRFQFDLSRAVYKALLRFTAWSEGIDPVVQPLAPTHVSAVHRGNGRVALSWRPQDDPLEPTATPDGYVVYRSRDGRAFDNGTYVAATQVSVEVAEGEEAYFRVAAVNAGGQSFPSRLVGVRWESGVEPMLIVDGFDRVAPPAWIENDDIAGFARHIDPGVAWDYNYALIGDVYDFNRASNWVNDEETPGWGGTTSDLVQHLELGNTFDHVARHGRELGALGHAFDSATADAFGAGLNHDWELVNWVAGLQKTTPPPAGMTKNGMPDRMSHEFAVFDAAALSALDEHLANGGRLILSGSYIAEDLIEGDLANNATRTFARESLGIAGFTPRATGVNHVLLDGTVFRFGAELESGLNLQHPVVRVHAPEAFEPADGFEVRMIYGENDAAAVIGSDRVTLFGFPLESVTPDSERRAVFGEVFGGG